MQSVARKVELRDVAEGLWIWRMEHPKWKRDQGWEPIVTSTVVESKGERLVLDPLAPPESETDVWERLDARPPTAACVFTPNPVRDVGLFAPPYCVPPYGPRLLFPASVPSTNLEATPTAKPLSRVIQTLSDGPGRA